MKFSSNINFFYICVHVLLKKFKLKGEIEIEMELHRALKISQKRNSFMYRLSKPAPQQIFPESYSASVLIESLRSQIFIFHGVKIFIPRRPLILPLTFTVPSSSSCVTLSNCMTALLNFTLIFQRIFTSSKTYCVRPLYRLLQKMTD